jgi:hypothetical protein
MLPRLIRSWKKLSDSELPSLTLLSDIRSPQYYVKIFNRRIANITNQLNMVTKSLICKCARHMGIQSQRSDLQVEDREE